MQTVFLRWTLVALMVALVQSQMTIKSNLPLYWGWFLRQTDTTEFLNLSRSVLSEALATIPDFRDDVRRFTNQTEIADILAHYSRENPEDVLHCTAMYNGVYPDYTPGAEDYANQQSVKSNNGEAFIIQAIGWVLTPRTFGARLKLDEDQLTVWNQNDTEGNPTVSKITRKREADTWSTKKYGRLVLVPQDPEDMDNFRPTAGRGSRAHLTLGCAPQVPAVTTGWDLVDVIRLEQVNATVGDYAIKDGTLRNYGNGQWVFYPRHKSLLPAVFRGSDTGGASTTGASVTVVALVTLGWIFKWFAWSCDQF